MDTESSRRGLNTHSHTYTLTHTHTHAHTHTHTLLHTLGLRAREPAEDKEEKTIEPPADKAPAPLPISPSWSAQEVLVPDRTSAAPPSSPVDQKTALLLLCSSTDQWLSNREQQSLSKC